MVNKIYLLFGMICLIGIVSSAYYVTSPSNCPATNIAYPGFSCAPIMLCGNPDCYDTSILTAPGSSSTTTGSGGSDYSCSDTTCSGGFVMDCFSDDGSAPRCNNGGSYLVDRNATCYNKHTQTTATASVFNQSSCSATCTTNYFACDGSTTDTDGCEILAGSSCGSATGTVVLNQCYSASAGNCTSATRLDCDDSDSDGNPATCNVGNGCEILIGGACTVGSLSGTYGSTCTGSAGTCVLTPQHFITSTKAEFQSNATHPFLWGVDYNLGHLLNLSWNGGGGLYANTSGLYFNRTKLGGSTTESDPLWTANQSSYYNKSDILGFSYWNSTNNLFNKTYADTLYYGISNPYSFWNSTFNQANETYFNKKYLLLTGGNLTGNLNVTNSNLSIGSRIKLALADCSALQSGEICRNSTGVFIQG